MATTTTLRRHAVGQGSRELQFVSFALGDQKYGVEVADVHGIYHGLSIVPNPDTPPFWEGEVQFSGRRIPVINLRRFAGMADAADSPPARWMVVIHGPAGPVGLLVDRVIEVLKLRASSLEAPDDAVLSPVADYVTAIANHDGGTVFLPDFTRLLHDATQSV
jgi:purine-binding chemotaxis protein CheW